MAVARANRKRTKPARRTGQVKPTGLLKSFSDARKQKSTLLGDVQAYLLSESQKPTDRRSDILHPSEMAQENWCHRQSFYRLAGEPVSDPGRGEKFSFQMENIFAEGHEIHRKWQGWLRDMGRLWGKWECESCGWTWSSTSPVACPECKSRFIVYREVPLSAEDTYLIAGHEDGADVETNSLIEIKSIGMGTLRMEEPALLKKWYVETVDGKKIYDLDGLWKDLKHPLLAHRKQTGVYLALAKHQGMPFDSVTFLYEYKATQSVKAFTVKYNESLIQPLLDKALEVKYALSQQVPPPRPEHTRKDKKPCTTCPWFTICYDEESNAPEEVVPDDGQVPSGTRRVRRRSLGRAGDQPAGSAGERSPRTAGGSYRAKRSRPDEPVQPDQPVGRVPGSSVRSSGGVREVRRRRG